MHAADDQLQRLVAHQRKGRLARLIACGGWLGFIQWCIVAIAIIIIAAAIIRRGDWLTATACFAIPAILVYRLRHNLVAWWPATRHVLNAVAVAIILSIVLRRSIPVLALPEADIVRLSLCVAHLSAYFWTLSDRGLYPSK